MTSFVQPSRGSGVLVETKGYSGLLLIENRNKALTHSEYMNSSNYGHHREVSIVTSGLSDHNSLEGRVFNPYLLIPHKGSQRIFASISS